MISLWRVALFFFIVLLGAGAGCRGGCSKSSLATLVATEGAVERDFAASVDDWKPASLGAEFLLGDGVRTAEKSSAILLLDDGSKAALANNTQLRFLETPEGFRGAGLELVVGEAVLQAGDQPLKLMTSVGPAVLEAGTKLSMKKSPRGVRFDVSVGRAKFETKTGTMQVVAGRGIEVDVGRAVIERFTEKMEKAPVDAGQPAPTAPKDAAVDTGRGVVVEVKKVAAQVRMPGQKKWQKITPGTHTVEAGSAVRVARGALVSVSDGGQRANLRGQGEFVVGTPGAAFVQTNSGGVGIDKQEATVQVAAPGGLLVIKRGSLVDVKARGRKGTDLEVALGEVEVQTKGGIETVRGGEGLHVDPNGAVRVSGRGPSYADLFIDAGGSIAIHDPKPPTSIGIRFRSLCTAGGIVELLQAGVRRQNGLSRGEASANILVPTGQHHYRVRCIGSEGPSDKPAAKGSIAIRHDSGKALLPQSAPRTLVDMDGRHYTVLYQSVLPEIEVRWRGAPDGNSYRLILLGPGVTKIVQPTTPRYGFASGEVPEGTHRLTFEGGGVRSPGTTLSIRFDNAAPMARISSPDEGSFAPGATVMVSGISLPGWKVSVAGKPLQHDAQSRFSGQVTVPGNQQALAIQFSHPSRGVRYYLRRSADAGR